MNLVVVFAAVPWGIGWQEIVMIFLLIGILAGPSIVALVIVLLTLRHQRNKRRTPPPLPAK